MNLTDEQQRVLNTLARRFLQSEDCSPSAIAAELGSTPATTKQTLDELEKLGLVARIRAPLGRA